MRVKLRAVLEKVEVWKKGKNEKRMKGLYFSTCFHDTENEKKLFNSVDTIASEQILNICMLFIEASFVKLKFFNFLVDGNNTPDNEIFTDIGEENSPVDKDNSYIL